MKKTLLALAITLTLASSAPMSARADDLDALAGKWVADRTGPDGQTYKQTLEIKKNKFIFNVGRGGETALYAAGDVKAEQLGSFKTAKFFNIRAGQSSSDLQSVDEERSVVYLLSGNELTTAVNFDKERSEPPMVTKYTKAAVTDEPKTLVIEKIVMTKSPQSTEYYLCLDATVGETAKRFNIPNKTYEKDGITITTDLAIPNVKADQTCKFVMKLDDVAGDECSEEMDNKSAGSFTVTAGGSQEFKPEDQWKYTIHWHLK
ncbi:MAG: hypothetical protein EXS35_14415 [Pedosphaera sp.]|nr:hypothetical protein [Pedosphaera sp.]